MSNKWPPLKHSLIHRMKLHLEYPKLAFEADIAIPARGEDGASDIASFRFDRLGGPTAADIEFRKELYYHIGAIAVAGGHVEAAMKRVILAVEDDGSMFEDVDLMWSALEKRLRVIAQGSDKISEELASVLDWGERRKVKKARDDSVHAYWWHWSGVGVTRSRFARKKSGQVMYGAREDMSFLSKQASLLFRYAERLDDLVEDRWAQARLVNDFPTWVSGGTEPIDVDAPEAD